LGLNIERELYDDENDSLDDEEREVLTKRQYWQGTYYYGTYTKDSFNVYFNGQKISGASVTSFQVLNYGYAKDSFNDYFNGQKIIGASVTSFQVLNNGYAKDSWNTYYMGKKV
jgi:hypothetical protein